ncbi:hypothetical protein EH151_12805 [Elizabethkingia anophelis]|uniref:hypothetical protein n=1 Tax=Elizabethkingia anophelis TaxID=1117645 RepID=UPI00136D1795|nr:hypothetical protein [Elizabethkingia anophelis]MYZ60766.1 hypothetical protein [Elizabethkingia anophelis]
MEFKGTKGKWILDGIDDELFMISSDVNDKGNVICQMPDEIVCKESLVHWKANAQLISKAPEMLEMLNKIIEEYKVGNHDNFIMSDLIDESEKLIKEATE